jgi:hypothetical protein
MLAEIFILRMEAISRASKETAPADNSRFVPITLADFNSELPLEFPVQFPAPGLVSRAGNKENSR